MTKSKLDNGVLRGTKYDEKEVYLVDFPSDENPTLSGIGACIRTGTNELLQLNVMSTDSPQKTGAVSFLLIKKTRIRFIIHEI